MVYIFTNVQWFSFLYRFRNIRFTKGCAEKYRFGRILSCNLVCLWDYIFRRFVINSIFIVNNCKYNYENISFMYYVVLFALNIVSSLIYKQLGNLPPVSIQEKICGQIHMPIHFIIFLWIFRVYSNYTKYHTCSLDINPVFLCLEGKETEKTS